MRPRRSPVRQHLPSRLLWALAVVACGGDGGTTEPPPPDPTITLNPTTLSLVTGETATIAATISNGSGTVTWSSSSSAVATVSPAGVVTAVAPGSATISAVLASRPTVTAAATVTVTDPPTSVAIAGITQNGLAADLNGLSKLITIEVDAQLPAGFQGGLEIQANGKVIGSAPIAAAAPPVAGAPALAPRRIAAVANTRAIQVVSADQITALTPNGIYDISAILKSTGGQTVAQSPLIRGTFANRHDLVIVDGQVINGQSGTNPLTGKTFSQGDLKLVINGVSFDGSVLEKLDEATIENVDVLKAGPGVLFGADAVSGVVNVILKKDVPLPSGFVGIGEGTFYVNPQKTRIVTNQGTYAPDILNYRSEYQGLGLPGATFDLDFLPPFIPQNPTLDPGKSFKWVNRSFDLKASYSSRGVSWDGPSPTVTDGGIGGIDCQFFKGPDFTTKITVGDDLGETATANIGLRLGCRDLFGNWAWRDNTDGAGAPQTIGGDFTKPVTTFLPSLNSQLGITEYQINPPPGRPLFPSHTDPIPLGLSSGIANMRYIRGMAFAPGLTTEASCVTGSFSSGQCREIEFTAPALVPSLSLSAEFRYDARATDVAGNAGDAKELWFLNDAILPVVGPASASAPLEAGKPVSFAFSATDNLEVSATAMAGIYSDLSARIIWGYQEWGKPFDGQFASSTQSQFDVPGLVTSLEVAVLGLNGFYQPSGVPKHLTQATWGAIDAAGNIRNEVASVSPTTAFQSFKVGSNGTDGGEFNVPSLNLCHRPVGVPGNCQGLPEQFQLIYDQYYPAGGVDRIQSFSFSKSLTVNGQEIAFPRAAMPGTTIDFGSFYVRRFSETIKGTDYPPGAYKLFGLAFDGQGNALKTQDLVLTVTPAIVSESP
jgi:hypothetical protein